MSGNRRAPLSVVMIVRNEAARIERALQSAHWADEIVVIDAFSEDGTVDICRRYTDRIMQYPWQGFAKQRQRSLEHATHEWVFSLDADEAISEALRADILAVLQEQQPRAGYRVPRQTRYLGRWIEHSGWFPDYQLRLFQKNKAVLQARNVHEGFSVRGDTGDLNGVLYHFSYNSLAQHLEKINRYTSLEAPEKLQQLGGKRIGWHHLVFNPLSCFWRMYISRQGFRDGFQGFLLACMGALYTQMLYAKMWEMQRQGQT